MKGKFSDALQSKEIPVVLPPSGHSMHRTLLEVPQALCPSKRRPQHPGAEIEIQAVEGLEKRTSLPSTSSLQHNPVLSRTSFDDRVVKRVKRKDDRQAIC